jgi:hypothetical protein
MAVNQKLVDFMVDLVVNDTFRAQFQNPANREAMMTAAGLNNEAKDAIRQSDAASIERQINTQVLSAPAPRAPQRGKKPAGSKPKSKAKKATKAKKARKR